MRLRILRPGETFNALCNPDQVEKLRRVAVHNEGELWVNDTAAEGVTITVRKVVVK